MISAVGQQRQSMWKLFVDCMVMQSEVRMRWAEWALAFVSNRKRSKRL